MGNSSIFSSPSSETYSYSSLTGLVLSSFRFCNDPKTLELVWGFNILDLERKPQGNEGVIRGSGRLSQWEVLELVLMEMLLMLRSAVITVRHEAMISNPSHPVLTRAFSCGTWRSWICLYCWKAVFCQICTPPPFSAASQVYYSVRWRNPINYTDYPSLPLKDNT